MDLAKFMHLPIVASAHGQEIDTMIYLIHLLMAALFVGWGIFFIYTLARFNRRSHPKADYVGVTSHASSTLEVAVAIAEIILLVGFSIPFWAKQVNAFPNRPDTIEVHITAEQFAWNIHYPGPDGIFGITSIKFFDKQSNPIGLDPNDPNGKDDVATINQLHLPIGRPVIIYLTSRDVMHSFGIPVMRVKQDVIPGINIPTWFIPTKTSPKGKPFDIACAQLCGIGHYKMKGYLTIETQEEFDKWIADQVKSNAGSGGSDSFWN